MFHLHLHHNKEKILSVKVLRRNKSLKTYTLRTTSFVSRRDGRLELDVCGWNFLFFFHGNWTSNDKIIQSDTNCQDSLIKILYNNGSTDSTVKSRTRYSTSGEVACKESYTANFTGISYHELFLTLPTTLGLLLVSRYSLAPRWAKMKLTWRTIYKHS